MDYLSGGVVVLGVEGVDGEDNFGNGARRVGVIGWRLERGIYEVREFDEPCCSLRFACVQQRIDAIVAVAIFMAASRAAFFLVHGATARARERENDITDSYPAYVLTWILCLFSF